MLHVFIGLQADQLVGAGLPDAALTNASLDSQNRFYGAVFVLFGAVSWICAGNVKKYIVLFRLQMAAFFLGGLTRLLPSVAYGLPSIQIQILGMSELIIPPPFIVWHAAALRKNVR